MGNAYTPKTYAELKRSTENFIERYKGYEKAAKEAAGKEGEKHSISTQPNYGYFSRGEEYRANGYFYINENSQRKSVYNACEQFSYRYDYPACTDNEGKEYYNFLVGSKPFENQCHHMLCDEVFSEKESRFSTDEMALLRKVPYSINRGENLIFLPVHDKYCSVHRLPYHNGSHPHYNDLVAGKMDGIKDSINEMKTKPCDGKKSPPEKVIEKLKLLENKFWTWHIQKGSTLVGKSIQNHAKDDVMMETLKSMNFN